MEKACWKVHFEKTHYKKMGWFAISLQIRFLSYNDHLQLICNTLQLNVFLQVWVLLDKLHEL